RPPPLDRGRPDVSQRRGEWKGGSPAAPQSFALGGRRAVAEAIRAGRATRVFAAKGTKETGGLRAVVEEAERSGVPVEWTTRSQMERMGLEDPRGVAALVAAPRELDERAIDTLARDAEALVVVLDGITD